MKDQSSEKDTLEDYVSIHRKKYEERMLKEKKLEEMEKNEKLIKDLEKQEAAYEVLQVEKDKEYSKQYYKQINNLDKMETISTDNTEEKVMGNYIECLIETPENYIQNSASQRLLGDTSDSSIKNKVMNYFKNHVRPCMFCTPFQVICNVIVLILVLIFIIFLGSL